MSNDVTNGLPSDLEELRQEAKRLRRASLHQESYAVNMQLAKESRRVDCDIGEVLGLRFMGVCMYRLGRSKESHELLLQARDRATASKLYQQELYIANHLGATLRHLGHFEQAHETFRGALERIRFPRDLEAKARLLGSLGAFYDEIGYLQGADDCYARYEELVEFIVFSGKTGDLPRLANARAFAGRSALRRGDLETAKAKHDDEYRIALESDDQLRIRDAIFHRAKIQLELGLRTKRADHLDESAAGFEQADELFTKNNQPNRMADVLHHRGRLYEAQGRWSEAYDAWRRAWKFSCECKHLYRQAQSSLELARFCQRWALHGESLYWFGQAARIRVEQYAPFAKSNRIMGLTQTRLAELHDVAKKVAEESRRVEREESESNELNKLVKEITGNSIQQLAEPLAFQSVEDWHKRIRRESRERWEKLLSAERFARLNKHSQDDLVMADVLYHGVVDELPRAALLIAIVVERELRERLFVPLHKEYPHARDARSARKLDPRSPTAEYFNQWDANNVPIGNAFRMLDEILDKRIRHRAVDFGRESTRPVHDKLKHILYLDREIEPLGLSSVKLRFAKLRNEAAHGNERAAKLDRMTVDAMKRRLVLESPMILATILDVDLRRV